MADIMTYGDETFESIKHVNEFGQEYWLARELSKVLQYSDWRNFENAIFKAMEACSNSGNLVNDHFGNVTTLTKIGTNGTRKVGDYADTQATWSL